MPRTMAPMEVHPTCTGHTVMNEAQCVWWSKGRINQTPHLHGAKRPHANKYPVPSASAPRSLLYGIQPQPTVHISGTRPRLLPGPRYSSRERERFRLFREKRRTGHLNGQGCCTGSLFIYFFLCAAACLLRYFYP